MSNFSSRAGASTTEAAASATSLAADACGVGDRKGRLRAGFDADILIVNGDLRADIGRLADVRAVIQVGHRVA